VVVHLVYRTKTENISDAQVKSQIDVLNRDRSKVPKPFRDLVADARIQFALAATDPDGQQTSGITRTATTERSFGTDDGVKTAANGGTEPWDTDRILNVWVCRLADALLGYAQFPGGPAETDGVVITHSAFGTRGTAAAPFDKGRTTTHEIGHYLNLSHIWGESRFATCQDNDFVADTPNQFGPNYHRPTYPSISCGNQPYGDLFMNYMDYVDDTAMVMFTQDQVARMQAALTGPRKLLGT